MKILNNSRQFLSRDSTIALTIGNFDGVHLGHQAVLRRLNELASCSVIFTFSNHPSEVLHGASISRLTTLTHRTSLIEKMGVDFVILTPFTKDFSKKTAQHFLTELKEDIPFSYLILGHDAVIGHDRKSDLQDLSEKLCFKLEYLEPIHLKGKIVSSSEIRKCILAGKLQEAGLLLGRPYSISACVQQGHGKGKEIGFHTANLPVEELALPPVGVYAVEVAIGSQLLPAVANLGYAPTLHTSRPLCLEVHLIDDTRDLYGTELEVFLIKYLRSEKKFENLSALQEQIRLDIQQAKESLIINQGYDSINILQNSISCP